MITSIDEIDRKLINIMQSRFPLTSRPFETLGEKVGITEKEALERVKHLYETKIVRRIGASFNTQELNHRSVLVAAKVPSDELERVADIVSSFPEVTHNYSRSHEYNLWFTLITPCEEDLDVILQDIRDATSIQEMQPIPARRRFKIQVNFDV